MKNIYYKKYGKTYKEALNNFLENHNEGDDFEKAKKQFPEIEAELLRL